MKAFKARTTGNTAIYAYEQAPTTFADEEMARFRAVPAAWADWESRPPSYKKVVTHWVTSAKGAATRTRRLETLIVDSAAGRKVGPMRWSRDQ